MIRKELPRLHVWMMTLTIVISMMNLLMMFWVFQTVSPAKETGIYAQVPNRAFRERENPSNDVITGGRRNAIRLPVELSSHTDVHQVAGNEFPLAMEDVVFIGKRRRPVFLTIGIPTVYRKSSGLRYLEMTLNSFIENIREEEQRDVTILLFAADANDIYRREVVKFLQEKYKEHLESGFMLIMTVPTEAYPRLLGLKQNFNDSQERVQWRSKQVLDVCFTFYVGRILSKYYLHMEDDTLASPRYVTFIRDFIDSQTEPWTALSFSGLYSIGRLFKSSDIDRFAKFLYLFYDEQPFDWLFARYFAAAAKPPKFRVPSLFQNIGDSSSLEGKNMSSAKDPFFISELNQRNPPQHFPSISENPPAKLYTTMMTFQQYEPVHAYTNPGPFFWAVYPQQKQTLSILFDDPVHVNKVFVQTGNDHHPDDLLKQAELHLCYSALGKAPDTHLGEPRCTGCLCVATINETDGGRILLEDLAASVPITTKCLRITILETHWNWVLFNQILVVPMNTVKEPIVPPAAPKLRQIQVPQGGKIKRKYRRGG